MRDRRLQIGVVLGLMAVLAVPGLPSRCCCAKTALANSAQNLPPCCAARLARKLPVKSAVTHQCQCRVKVANPTILPPKSTSIVKAHAAGLCLPELRLVVQVELTAATWGDAEFRPPAAVSRSIICCWVV
jgi:hypothetical protein